MDSKVIVDLEKAEQELKPKLNPADWIEVYGFLSGCEDYSI